MEFAKEHNIALQMLWLYSLYLTTDHPNTLPSLAEVKLAENQTKMHFLAKEPEKIWPPANDPYYLDLSILGEINPIIQGFKKKALELTTTKIHDSNKKLNLIMKMTECITQQQPNRRREVILVYQKALESLTQLSQLDARTQTDLQRYIVNDVIVELVMSPTLISTERMQVLKSIGNNWCPHLHKGLVNSVLQWSDSYLETKLLKEKNATVDEQSFSSYLSALQTLSKGHQYAKQQEFEEATHQAQSALKTLDELWSLACTEFSFLFENTQKQQRWISYLISSVIHENDAKVPDFDAASVKIKAAAHYIRKVIPAGFQLSDEYLSLSDDYYRLINNKDKTTRVRGSLC